MHKRLKWEHICRYVYMQDLPSLVPNFWHLKQEKTNSLIGETRDKARVIHTLCAVPPALQSEALTGC